MHNTLAAMSKPVSPKMNGPLSKQKRAASPPATCTVGSVKPEQSKTKQNFEFPRGSLKLHPQQYDPPGGGGYLATRSVISVGPLCLVVDNQDLLIRDVHAKLCQQSYKRPASHKPQHSKVSNARAVRWWSHRRRSLAARCCR